MRSGIIQPQSEDNEHHQLYEIKMPVREMYQPAL
jgi:hypothetical protein